MREIALCVVFVAMGSLVAGVVAGQALRQGQKLPNGPPRYYLRAGSIQEICAPMARGGWVCQPTIDVVKLMLQEPPDCGDVTR